MSRSEIVVESVLVGCDGIVLAKSRLGSGKIVIFLTKASVAVSTEVKTKWTQTETTKSMLIKQIVIANNPLLPLSKIVGLSKTLQVIMLGVPMGSFPTWYIGSVLSS